MPLEVQRARRYKSDTVSRFHFISGMIIYPNEPESLR